MAGEHNPQLEDGYTRVANEWLEAFLRYKAPASLKDFVMAVVRATWGWQAKLKAIPISTFERLLGVSNRRIYQLRREAIRHNLILFEAGEHSDTASYGVQKKYLEWVEYNSPQPIAGTKHPLQSEGATTVKGPVRAEPEGATTGIPEGASTDSKESLKDSTKETSCQKPEAKTVSAAERRRKKIEEEQQLLAEFDEEEQELLDDYMTCADEGLKTGTTVGGRVARLKALIDVANEVDDPDAFRYGLHQANQARAANPNYVKKAAISRRDRQ